MLNKGLHLSKEIFEKDSEKVPTRNGYGEGLVEAGKKDERVVVLSADLKESTRSQMFEKKFPERFIEVGVAEQALATIASGMANYGKVPFISSYATFSPGRNWEQIRTTIALNDVPVKIAGHHAGISVGPDGATHQALEDIALMRVIPNMIVVVPCDSVEAKKATVEAAKNGKPTYLRFAREKTPVITSGSTPFKIGKAEVFWSPSRSSGRLVNPQVAIVACGPLVYEALFAAKQLEEEGTSTVVVNNHTIKPLDEDLILNLARKVGAIVTVEEHQAIGGLGGAVSEFLAKSHPVPIEFIGISDSFGESGEPDELLTKYKMKSKDIVQAVKKVILRKEN